MRIILAISLLSSLVVAPAWADTGIYAGVDVNTYSLTNLQGTPNPGSGLRISGGYKFSPMVAVELGYDMSGKGDVAGITKYSMTSIQGAAVGTYSINDQFELFGKLGYASNSIKLDSGTCNNCSNSGLMYGVGAQFNLNKMIGIRAQYANLGKTTKNGNNDSVASTIGAGVVFNF